MSYHIDDIMRNDLWLDGHQST